MREGHYLENKIIQGEYADKTISGHSEVQSILFNITTVNMFIWQALGQVQEQVSGAQSGISYLSKNA
jgi:hypothetical protein